MSKLPTVAIIGRPNTGKSTLFNRLIGERKAIESSVAGTTRDHISKRITLAGMPVLLIDTGGIGASRDKDFEKDVAEQSLMALEFADLILFTVNGQEDVTADDERVIEYLRKKRRRHVPVIVVITKVDDPTTKESVLANFQEINIGDGVIAISAPHRMGLEALSNAVAKELKKMHFVEEVTARDASRDQSEGLENSDEDTNDENDAHLSELTAQSSPARIAIIGKPNVGKSSIVNALMTEDQRQNSPLLVSPIAGTTRDAVDTQVTYHGTPYILVDTAGLKKHSRNLDEIERYAMMRTITSVESADIVILVLDASEPIAQQDKRIASLAVESGKGLIILLNKIDTMKGEKRKQVIEYTEFTLHFCSKFAKIIPCSAITRDGLLKIFDQVEAVQLSRTRRISTRELHRWFEQNVHGRPLGEIAKAKHLTQTKDIPPTFVLFVKRAKSVNPTQLRYLENSLRKTFGFDGTPIRWVLKGEEEEEKKRKIK